MSDNRNLFANKLDFDSPSMQCKVFDRLAVQNPLGKTQFYCLELSAGNTFDFGFCRKENVQSLLREVLTVVNMKVLRGSYERIMIPSVPCSLWVKQARKYDPKTVIMWLENSLELTEEYKESLLRLYKQGMKFAVRVDAMGEIPTNSEVLSCIDYVLVDAAKPQEYADILSSLKKNNKNLKTIGFKDTCSIFNFAINEASNFDYVLGMVQSDLIKYDGVRPKWQHDMLRLFAQLYSSFYDIKEVGEIVAQYPLMGTAMKKLMSSKALTVLTLRSKTKNQMLAENQSLTQNDLRNYLVISVAFNLFTLTDKNISDINHHPFDMRNINYDPFIQALVFGKIVDFMGQELCDDISAPQAFISGFMRYCHVFLHDTEKATFSEFPLDAVSSCFKEGGGEQLGKIIRTLSLLFEHKVAEALELAYEEGMELYKDKIYNYISQAYLWADTVLKALDIAQPPAESA